MLEDIENLTTPQEEILQRQSLKQVNIKKYQKVKKESNIENQKSQNDHFLPGQHKIFLKTWGCSHNNSDSEYMAGLLSSQGYHISFSDNEKENADIWILNSCTVKNPSEQTFVNEIQKAKTSGKKLIVAGCVPQAQQKGQWLDHSVIGVQQIDRVVEVVEESLKGNTIQILGSKRDENKKRKGGADLDLPKIRKNPFIEIIPINTGCLNQCTYCKTKHARGDLASYPPEEIINRIESVVKEGVVEIWLTSEDTGAYGRDIGLTIADLLTRIAESLDKIAKNGKSVMLRFGMTNPPYILDDLPQIADFLNHPNVYKFLHIPIQSGSDFVLNEMRRQYTNSDFRTIVDYLKEKVPNITIATDIICGFPSETDEDHSQSVKIVQDYQFPVLHISQFYPRPGTPAALMKRLPTNIVKERSREITKLFNSYSTFDHMLGETQKVWITDEMNSESIDEKKVEIKGEDDYEKLADKKIGSCWVSHNQFYNQVLIPKEMTEHFLKNNTSGTQTLLGHICEVKIVQTGKFFLIGKITDFNSIHLANQDPITSTVLLHRTGKNNRSVTSTKINSQISHEKKKSFKDLFALSLLFAFHFLSIPFLLELLNIPSAISSSEFDFGMKSLLYRYDVQIILWLLTIWILIK